MDRQEARKIFYGAMGDLGKCNENLSTAHNSADSATENATTVKSLAEELSILVTNALRLICEGERIQRSHLDKGEEAGSVLEYAGTGNSKAASKIIDSLLEALVANQNAMESLLPGVGSLAKLNTERLLPLQADSDKLFLMSKEARYQIDEGQQGISGANIVGWNYGDTEL